MHNMQNRCKSKHTTTKVVSLTSCVFVKSAHTLTGGWQKAPSWPSWGIVLLPYSVIAQADLGGFPWCRMMPTLTSHIPVPRPSYTQARENLVRAIPPKLLCLLACGGKDCRYEGPDCWELKQQVIRGLFSSW